MENSTVLLSETQWGKEMKSESVLLEMDTAGMGFLLEIWPKGSFSFSPQNGFVGEAEKIRLSGQAVHKKSLSQVQKVAEAELGSQKMQQQEKVVLKSEGKQRQVATSPSFKWVLVVALLLAVLALAWFIRRV